MHEHGLTWIHSIDTRAQDGQQYAHGRHRLCLASVFPWCQSSARLERHLLRACARDISSLLEAEVTLGAGVGASFWQAHQTYSLEVSRGQESQLHRALRTPFPPIHPRVDLLPSYAVLLFGAVNCDPGFSQIRLAFGPLDLLYVSPFGVVLHNQVWIRIPARITTV